jgi:hypothetical protein
MDNIKEIAVGVDERIIRKQLSDDELTEIKDEIASLSVKIQKLEEDKKALLEEYSGSIKPLRLELAQLVKKARSGYVESIYTCYLVPNHIDGIMSYYSEEGEVLEERPLTREERQLTINDNIGKE